MLVVSDTTPLNYLVLTGLEYLVPQLFGTVLVPEAVLQELTHPGAPEVVRAWALAPAAWILVRPVTVPRDMLLAELDPGEREAIVLAAQVGANLLLLDEAAARREAARRGLEVAGTLALLDLAADRGLIEFPVGGGANSRDQLSTERNGARVVSRQERSPG